MSSERVPMTREGSSGDYRRPGDRVRADYYLTIVDYYLASAFWSRSALGRFQQRVCHTPPVSPAESSFASQHWPEKQAAGGCRLSVWQSDGQLRFSKVEESGLAVLRLLGGPIPWFEELSSFGRELLTQKKG